MGSYLLKQSKLRADEIVHYAYQFAHEYDREYGSAGFGDSFLPKDEMLRIITDKAMNSIPNCDSDSAFRVAISTQKVLETMGITVKVAKIPRTDVYKDQWKKGEKAWFEYHCFESDSSCDADLWHHSHEQVVVLGEADADGSSKKWPDSTPEQRAENGTPRVYRVRFSDGKTFDAAEDELMTSADGFYRPNPPKRKKAVSEESHQMNMEVNALDPQRDIGGNAVGGEESPANFMADEGLEEPDKKYNHPFGLGIGTEPENVRYGADEKEHGQFQDAGIYDEADEARHRQTAKVEANYAEDGVTFDPSGDYLCGECTQSDHEGGCATVDGVIDDATGSCAFWEKEGNGLVQLESKFTQKEAAYTERPQEKGFGCHRCEYGAEAKTADSHGRKSWCSYWGMHVLPNACCAKNEGDNDVTPKTASFKSALLKKATPKCPHCGSTDYGLMPSDFETAKCNKCGKNWDHGIVPGVNDPSEKVAKGQGGGIHGDEAVDFYRPTQTLAPRYDQRKHIDENMIDDPIKDDFAADKKKMEGPTPATGHAPLRRDLAQRNFMASDDDEYWMDMVNENEANAKKRFAECDDIKQIAQDNGWTMEQAWDEIGADFANALYDPRNRLVASKTATLEANRPNAEAYNEFEVCRAAMVHLVTGEHTRNISADLMSKLNAISDEMEQTSKDWNAAAGQPPQAHEYDEPKRSPLLDINDVLDPEG